MLKKISELTLDTVIDHNDVVPINNGGTTKKTFGLNLKNDLFTQFSNTGAIRDGMNSGDPYINNVSLLLHGDGTNNAQNNTFRDSSSNDFTITRNGTPTQGSFSPYNENWSNYFNGSTDYLYVPDNDAFYLTGDFTIEAWVYQTSSKNVSIVAQWGVGLSTQSFIFRIESTGKLSFAYDQGSGGLNATASSSSITYNSWNHVAFVRSGSTVSYYINGVKDSVTNTISGAFRNAVQPIVIGLYNTTVDTYFNGYISNLRFVKGTALYTSNFTPSTSNLTAVAGTSLLTCQSNTFKDNSSNNFAITAAGTPSVSLESPFKSTSAYSPTVNGGSGYFNGINYFLTVPSNAAFSFGTGDFTVEYWAYYPSFSNTNGKTIIDSRPLNTNGNYWITGLNNTGIPAFTTMASGGVTLFAPQSYPNQWIHVAATRNSGTLRLFINGTQVAISSGNVDNISSSGLAIGANAFRGTAPDTYFNGSISNLRIVNGTAIYTSNFTPPTSPVTAVANTSLLLNFTNGGVIDSVAKNNLITVGDAKVSTSVVKYGTGAMYFDGTGDYLQAPGSINFAFGTGNYTAEGWLNVPNTNTGHRVIVNIGTPGTNFYLRQDGTKLGYYDSTNTIRVEDSNFFSSLNTWIHFALVRFGTTVKIFKNGTEVSSGTSSTNHSNSTSTFDIGGIGGNYFNGYIDDLRITKGVARYTANFTPPTQAFPDVASSFGADLTGTYKWTGGTLAPNGKIYGIPTGSTSVLVIDPVTNTTSSFGSLTTGTGKWLGGSLAPNGKIYGIPSNSTSVLVIDPATNTTSTFGSLGSGTEKWAGGVLAPNGKIYGIPYDSTSILVIDPTTNTVSTFGNLTGTNKWIGGVLAPNGKIYGITYSSTSVLIIDAATNTISTFGNLTGNFKWTGGVLAPNGKIYGIPYASGSVLIIDPATNTTSTFVSTSNYLGGALATNGKIYGISQNATSVLVIDPATNTTSTFGSLTGNDKWWGGVLAPNGKIYGIPFFSTDILQITPGLNTSSPNLPLDRCISAYYNKF